MGKKANLDRLAYESNKSDKNLKSAYKDSNKAYKKALRGNTTHRKGSIRGEVGSDMSRKYLSEAKKIQKQLNADPSNRQLKKQYNNLMSKHDVERAKARKAPEVGARRSYRKAAIKRGLTMTVKSAATTAAIGAGIYAVNSYLNKRQVIINGKRVQFSSQNIRTAADIAKKVKDFMGYVY